VLRTTSNPTLLRQSSSRPSSQEQEQAKAASQQEPTTVPSLEMHFELAKGNESGNVRYNPLRTSGNSMSESGDERVAQPEGVEMAILVAGQPDRNGDEEDGEEFSGSSGCGGDRDMDGPMPPLSSSSRKARFFRGGKQIGSGRRDTESKSLQILGTSDSLAKAEQRFRNRRRWIIGTVIVLLATIVIAVASVCGSGQCGGAGGQNSSNTPASASTGDQQGEGSSNSDEETTPVEPGASPTVNPSRESGSGSSTEISPLANALGPNVFLIDPSWTTAQIQATFDDVFQQQQNNEMGTERYALYFLPGTYGSTEDPLMVQIGYYTDVAGLGETPDDVQIYGKIEVYNRCFEPDPYQEGQFVPTQDASGLCFALNSFWRSLSNLRINIVTPPTQDACRSTAMFWAISQASSMRRVHITGGDVSLMDYCSSTCPAVALF